MSERTVQSPEHVPAFLLRRAEALAWELYEQGRLDAAQNIVGRLLSHTPSRDDLWALSGVIARRRGAPERAKRALGRAVALNPKNFNAKLNLAEVCIAAGEVAPGVKLLRAVLDERHVDGLPASEQDRFAKRAGVQLAFIEELLTRIITSRRCVSPSGERP